jgi:hypothetical protein
VHVQPTATAPDPVVSAYVESEEVIVDISVTPSTAQLTVDGVKAAGGMFHTKVAPGKFEHDVRAEAPGYEPRTMRVQFDRDRTVEIALTKSTPGAPPPRPGPAPGTAPTPAPGSAAGPSPGPKPSRPPGGDNPY